MTTNIDEAVAKKMGWEVKPRKGLSGDDRYYNYWHDKDGAVLHITDPPSFSTDWNATKILIRWMRGRGIDYEIINWGANPKKPKFFRWVSWEDSRIKYSEYLVSDGIEIEKAACEAFLLIPDKDLEVNDD